VAVGRLAAAVAPADAIRRSGDPARRRGFLAGGWAAIAERRLMKSKYNAWVAAMAAVAVLLGGAGCHSKDPQALAAAELPPARVSVLPVDARPFASVEEVVGTIRARRRTVLEAKVSGRIVSLESRLGHAVKAGETLVQLDASELVARVEQARVVLEQATRERDRFQGLLAQRTVSPQEFETVESRWKVAKAGLSEAETLLGYLKVVAPFDAVVSRKLAEVGDLSTPGRPLLELEVPGELRLEADVGEALIDRIRVGQVLTVRTGADSRLQGTVAEIAPAADAGTRTFLVKVDLPSGTSVRSGAFGRLGVPLSETMVMRVPPSAVLRRGQLEYVMVESSGKAQLRLVRTGRVLGDGVELISGVENGERVILTGLRELVEGQRLEVVP
jgi:RND family efflux transporter MFP subunit